MNKSCGPPYLNETRYDAVTRMTDWMLSLQVLLLLLVANGAPIIAKKLLHDRFGSPLDCGLILPDGEPLFGAAKTVRGVILSVVCTAGAAVLLHMEWSTGAKIAALSMLGDLFSSLIKRRLHLKAHAQAFGLDQIPEALLPLLAVKAQFNLTSVDIAVLLIAFIVLELVLSRLLFWLRIRDRPY
jgi:CDP-2,3-bis-(O-geranylgeranyl)-sn-glycerol synthase